MLLLLLAVPLGVLAGGLGRGSLVRLAQVPWRGGPWVVVACGLRVTMAVLVARVAPTGPAAVWWSCAGALLTYGLLLAVAVANRSLPGTGLLALGAVANLVAIGAGGGRMPYWTRAAAWVAGGTLPRVSPFGHEPVAHLGGLRYLADVLPLPGPLASVVSGGDVLLALGAFWLIARLMTSGPAPAHS